MLLEVLVAHESTEVGAVPKRTATPWAQGVPPGCPQLAGPVLARDGTNQSIHHVLDLLLGEVVVERQG